MHKLSLRTLFFLTFLIAVDLAPLVYGLHPIVYAILATASAAVSLFVLPYWILKIKKTMEAILIEGAIIFTVVLYQVWAAIVFAKLIIELGF